MEESGGSVSDWTSLLSTFNPSFLAPICGMSRTDRLASRFLHTGTSANMQVITAIYLNCRPDLRDEWLSGNEVDDLTEAQVIVFVWKSS